MGLPSSLGPTSKHGCPNKAPLVIIPHRAIGAIVAAGGLGKCFVVSAHSRTNHHAKTRVTPENWRFLSCLGSRIKSVGLPACVGADWQMEPQVMENSQFPKTFVLRCMSHNTRMVSCISIGGTAISSIEYFLVHKDCADVVDRVFYCGVTRPKPHRPTYLQFLTLPNNFKVMVIKGAQALASRATFWPIAACCGMV